MTLKQRIATYISVLFSLIYLIASVIIFVLFSNYRKEEFKERLEKKAISSVRLLIEVQEIDRYLLRIIDQNTIIKLYNEKTLIFDAGAQLIYSSVDDAVVDWSLADLRYLKQKGSFLKAQGDYEVYGYFYDSDNKDYYVLVAAEDRYGIRKLRYLGVILLISYVFFTGLVCFVAFTSSKKLLLPLKDFLFRIRSINVNNLNTRIEEQSPNPKDEINELALEFNQMMTRIEDSYRFQKGFSAYASHELRTPLARILARLENSVSDTSVSGLQSEVYAEIVEDVNQMTALINSLLILGKVEAGNKHFELTRLDELLFDAFAKVKRQSPDFQMSFELSGQENLDILLEAKINRELFEISFINLLKNAYQYDKDRQVNVRFQEGVKGLEIVFSSQGELLTELEKEQLFQPFSRGLNSRNTKGFGLGLVITHRILSYHGAAIRYVSEQPDTNHFIIDFPNQSL